MIPSGRLPHDHPARIHGSVHRSSRTPDVDPAQRAAEAALEKLLASWHSDGSRGLASAHLWEDAALDAIDALSVLMAEVDLAGAPPRLISQRCGS